MVLIYIKHGNECSLIEPKIVTRYYILECAVNVRAPLHIYITDDFNGPTTPVV